MNIPTRTPPKKRHSRIKGALSPLQEIEGWSWYCAKRELGSYKKQAKKMGVSENLLRHAIIRMLQRERNSVGRS